MATTLADVHVPIRERVRMFVDPFEQVLTDAEIDNFVNMSRGHDKVAITRAITRVKQLGRERADGRLVTISRHLLDYVDRDVINTENSEQMCRIVWQPYLQETDNG